MENRWPQRHADADAELFVTLDKPAYNDGDAMAVDVRLVVLRPLTIYTLLVLLHAEEVLEWRGFSSVSDTQDTRLVEEQMNVLPTAADEGRELAPGEYHFHATVIVPVGIPRFRYERDNCTATIKTFVKCILWTTDNPKRSKLSTGHFFDLVPSNNLAPPVPESNFEATGECDVRLLGLLSAGRCEVGIHLGRPGFNVDGDTVAQITIHSTQPKTKIKRISLSLVEEAQIVRKKKTIVTVIGSWDVPLDDNSELAAGAGRTANDSTLTSVVTLRVDPTRVHESVHLRLLIITHRLRVEIAYHGGASGTIEYPPISLLRD